MPNFSNLRRKSINEFYVADTLLGWILCLIYHILVIPYNLNFLRARFNKDCVKLG